MMVMLPACCRAAQNSVPEWVRGSVLTHQEMQRLIVPGVCSA